MKRLSLIVLAGLALGGVALAQPSPPPAAVNDPSLHAYGDAEKTCLAWTDSCRNCTRAASGDVVCSNIGIACQPQPIACTRREEPPKPADVPKQEGAPK